MTAKTYNQHEVTIVIGDVLIDSGYADGPLLEIERVTPRTTSVAGTDGEVAVSTSKDPRWKVKLHLMQTSDGNRRLQEKVNLVQAFGGSPSLGPVYIRDRNGLSLYEGDAIWLEEDPDATFDKSATERVWNFEAVLTAYEGGNNAA